MTDQSPTREEIIERLLDFCGAYHNGGCAEWQLYDPEPDVKALQSLLRSESQRIAELEGRLKDGASSVESAARRPSDVCDQQRGAPMDTAPRDGTMLWLFVNYSGPDADCPLADATRAWTIGFNNYDNDGEDEWKFAGWCWSHDHFTEGRGLPMSWKPVGFDLEAE